MIIKKMVSPNRLLRYFSIWLWQLNLFLTILDEAGNLIWWLLVCSFYKQYWHWINRGITKIHGAKEKLRRSNIMKPNTNRRQTTYVGKNNRWCQTHYDVKPIVAPQKPMATKQLVLSKHYEAVDKLEPNKLWYQKQLMVPNALWSWTQIMAP